MPSPWQDDLKILQNAGAPDDVIAAEKASRKQLLEASGTPTSEINAYFGEPEFDNSAIKKHILSTLQSPVEKSADGKVTQAKTLWDALVAGGQNSVTGLMRKRPDMVVTEDQGIAMRLAQAAGQFVGDLPYMQMGFTAGGAAGFAAGSEVPVVGNMTGLAIGGGAGAFALPAALRKILMDHYEKGDVKSFGEFWSRAADTAWETTKAGVVGGATAGAGGVAAKFAAPVMGPAMTAAAASTAEVVTMTTLGKTLEGQVPEPSDFLEASIFVGGMHAVGGVPKIAGKLREAYSRTGIKPSELAQEIQKNPVLKQEIFADNTNPSRVEEILTGRKPPETVQTEFGEIAVNKPEPKPVEQPPQRKPEIQKVLDTITKQPEKEAKPFDPEDLYTAVVDRRNPILQAEKALGFRKNLEAYDSPYQLSRMVGDSTAKFQHFLEFGPLKFKDLAPIENVKSYDAILEPIQDKQLFSGAVKALRYNELYNRGRIEKAELSHQEVKDFIKELPPEYKTAAKEFTEWRNSALDYAADSGLVDKTVAAQWKEYEFYGKIKRIFEPEETLPGKSGGKKADSFKKFSGQSERLTEDPVKATLEDVETLIRKAEENRVKQKMAEKAFSVEGQTTFEMVPEKEIRKAQARLKEVDGVFSYFENGKEKFVRTDPEIAKSLNTLGSPAAKNLAVQLMSQFTSALKTGTTLAPEFILRNAIRDKQTGGTFAQIKLSEMFSAVGDIYTKSPEYQAFLRSGGASGTFIQTARLLESRIFELEPQTGTIAACINTVKNLRDKYEAIGRVIEQAPRLARAKKEFAGELSGPNVFKGGFAAREATVDFERFGSSDVVQALNKITAFQGPAIQGLDRTCRAFAEDPKGFMTRGFTNITAPSLILWAYQKDDPRYKDLTPIQKDLYWNIVINKWEKVDDPRMIERMNLPSYMIRKNGDSYEINNGPILKIPKGQEVGVIFGSLPERLAEAFYNDNPKAFQDFLSKTVARSTIPIGMPDLFRPIFEQKTNFVGFTDNPIVPHSLERFSPQDQYTDYTSETAKLIGKMLSPIPYVGEDSTNPNKGAQLSSPLVIENYVRAWGGQIGDYALKASDYALKKAGVVPDLKAKGGIEDIPFVKAFITRYPNANTKSIQDFREAYDKADGLLANIRSAMEVGDTERVERLTKNKSYELVKLQSINNAMNNLRRLIRVTNANTEYSKDEKRQIIQGAYWSMIQASQLGVQAINDLEKKQKAEQVHKPIFK